MKVLRTETK